MSLSSSSFKLQCCHEIILINIIRILIILKPIAVVVLKSTIFFTFRHSSQVIMIIITLFAFPITLSYLQSRSAVPNSLNRQPRLPSIIARPSLAPSIIAIIAIRQFFPSLLSGIFFSIIASPGFLQSLPSLPAGILFSIIASPGFLQSSSGQA